MKDSLRVCAHTEWWGDCKVLYHSTFQLLNPVSPKMFFFLITTALTANTAIIQFTHYINVLILRNHCIIIHVRIFIFIQLVWKESWVSVIYKSVKKKI